MHAAFHIKFPDDKISFSKFCSLQPKWCVCAGSSGTHSVCVCTIHQNIILLIDTAQITESWITSRLQVPAKKLEYFEKLL